MADPRQCGPKMGVGLEVILEVGTLMHREGRGTLDGQAHRPMEGRGVSGPHRGKHVPVRAPLSSQGRAACGLHLLGARGSSPELRRPDLSADLVRCALCTFSWSRISASETGCPPPRTSTGCRPAVGPWSASSASWLQRVLQAFPLSPDFPVLGGLVVPSFCQSSRLQ